jgi:hypothetical protein
MWVQVDVGMPLHPKLLGKPPAWRWLWLCLLCRAKEHHSADGVVRGLPARTMAGLWNIGTTKVVVDALEYFASSGMARLDGDDVALLSWGERGNSYDPEVKREQWKKQKQRQRAPASGGQSAHLSAGHSAGPSGGRVHQSPPVESRVQSINKAPLAPVAVGDGGTVKPGSRAWERLRKAGLVQATKTSTPEWERAGCSSLQEHAAFTAHMGALVERDPTAFTDCTPETWTEELERWRSSRRTSVGATA